MDARTVDFETAFVNQRIVADEVVDRLFGKLANEIKNCQIDLVDGPACICKNAMVSTMMLCGVCRPQCAEDSSPGCKYPARDELPERLGGGLSHRCGKNF